MRLKSSCRFFAPNLCIWAGIADEPAVAATPIQVGASNWAWQNPAPQNSNLNAVTCARVPQTLSRVAVCDQAASYTGLTTGATMIWSSQTSSTTATLRAISWYEWSTLRSAITILFSS